ncbi:glycosyltransferase family 2 protein [Pontibacter sp. CAU 1760]
MENHTHLLSIIIPFHNSRGKCGRVLQNLLHLKHANTEIILVDDGSSDQTYEDLIEVSSKIKCKCHVVKQENRGPGGARNAGFGLARGKYVWFVDSDDNFRQEALVFLESVAEENYDFIDFNIESNKEVVNSVAFDEGEYTVNHEVRAALISNFGRIVSKVFNRTFLLDTGILYPENCVYEDNSLTFIYPFVVKRFYKSSVTGYVHHEEFESVTRVKAINQRFYDRLATALYGFEYSMHFVKYPEARYAVEERFIKLFLLNTVNCLITKYPGAGWLMAMRVMKYYQQVTKPMNVRTMPTTLLNANKKNSFVFKLLWRLSYALPKQQGFFEQLHLKAWGKSIKYAQLRTARLSTIIE